MINNISWSSYWCILGICTLLYYIYVLWVYYRNGLLQRFQPASFLQNDQASLSPDDELFPVAQSLNDEIGAYLEEAGRSGTPKPEIMFALQRIIQKYPQIKLSVYKDAVNRLVQFECKNKCTIHLGEEEIRQVWMDKVQAFPPDLSP